MPESEDPRELVRGALDGDPTSLQHLINRLAPVISKCVTSALWRRNHGARNVTQEAPDIVQEVFLSLFQADGRPLRAWDPARGSSLESFVGLLARHQTDSILRNGRTCPWREDPTDFADLDDLASDGRPPEAVASSRDELRQLLDRLCDRLSPRGLEIFTFMVIEEESVDELSVRLGLTHEALYQWRSRFSKLARQLSAEMESSTPHVRRSESPA